MSNIMLPLITVPSSMFILAKASLFVFALLRGATDENVLSSSCIFMLEETGALYSGSDSILVKSS